MSIIPVQNPDSSLECECGNIVSTIINGKAKCTACTKKLLAKPTGTTRYSIA